MIPYKTGIMTVLIHSVYRMILESRHLMYLSCFMILRLTIRQPMDVLHQRRMMENIILNMAIRDRTI